MIFDDHIKICLLKELNERVCVYHEEAFANLLQESLYQIIEIAKEGAVEGSAGKLRQGAKGGSQYQSDAAELIQPAF